MAMKFSYGYWNFVDHTLKNKIHMNNWLINFMEELLYVKYMIQFELKMVYILEPSIKYVKFCTMCSRTDSLTRCERESSTLDTDFEAKYCKLLLVESS